MSVCPSVCLSVCPTDRPSAWLPVCRAVCQSVCLCLSGRLSVCLSVCLCRIVSVPLLFVLVWHWHTILVYQWCINGWIIMRWYVAYIQSPYSTLTLDLRVKFIYFCRVFVYNPYSRVCLDISIPYLAQGSNTMRDIQYPDTTLTFYFKVKLIGCMFWHGFVFEQQLCCPLT